jgi:signal transduction histidine kinase
MTVELEALPVATLVVDADRVIRRANSLACELVGRPSLSGVLLDELLGPLDGGEEPPWLKAWHPSAALRSVRRVPEHAASVRRPDGTLVPITVSAAYRRDEAGNLTQVVVTARPTRQRGRHTPSGMEVISTVSHELRSPLTSVKGYTSLLLNKWDRLGDEQKLLMLGQVHHDADRVTRLVSELLDISRLETGRLHLRRQLVDLVEVAERVVAKVTMEYEGLGCELAFPPDFPQVYADPDKLEQVLTNLVENAAKYASPTGMKVLGSVAENEVAVEVHDRGEGIPEVDLPRVFTKFFRRDHGKPTGSGLGLWISRGLVEAHGGRLTATSIAGQGSIFRFTLPTDAFERLHG